MRSRKAIWLLAFSVIGLTASAGSAYVHYQLLQNPGYASFCDISETWNCASVYESQYGAFRGIPVAVLGLVWFAAAALLSGAALRGAGRGSPAAENVPGYLFAWSVVGLAFVLYLGYASLFVLQTYCVLCVITYAAVTGIFILSGSASTMSMTSLPGRALHDLRSIARRPAPLVVLLLFIGSAVSVVAFFPRSPEASVAAAATLAVQNPDKLREFEQWYASQPRVPLSIPLEGAKVLVVKFNDYQCPPCRQTYELYKPIQAKWEAQRPGLVRFVTKDYPLEPECNVHAPGGQHLAACEAAVAVRLAREKGRAEAMEAWLFSNQPSLTPSLVRDGAREIGRVTDFDARYVATLEQVRADIALGAQLGVRGTPTFFINGVRIPGVGAEYFDAAIAYELRLAGVE